MRSLVIVQYWHIESMILFKENPENRKIGASHRSALLVVTANCIFALYSPASAETTFGIYDARTLAMGGASVASANNDNAQFYNAALLAFNTEIEERTQDSRFLFPILVPQLSESAIDIEEISRTDPSRAITQAVADFNATPNAQTAQAVVDVTANVDAVLTNIDDEDLFGDLYIGLGISEPGKFQGAGFFMGVRLLAGGQTTVTATDQAVLDAYQEGLLFVASGGTEGTEHPEIFDAGGALIDPSGSFDSSADVTGAVITEIGVAMSKQMQLFGRPIAAGISFKVMKIETFEDTGEIVDDRIDVRQNSVSDVNVNFDVGLVKELGKHWRVALAVKDIIPHNYVTSLGTVIRFRPRPRIGVAYQSSRLQLAADADLTLNEPLGTESPTQEIAGGAEWSFDFPLKLRAGYRLDMRGNRDGIVSVGVGVLVNSLAIDLAYAQAGDARAAALQFGAAF